MPSPYLELTCVYKYYVPMVHSSTCMYHRIGEPGVDARIVLEPTSTKVEEGSSANSFLLLVFSCSHEVDAGDAPKR